MRNLSFQKLQQEGRLLCNAVEIGATKPTAGYCAEIQTVMPGSSWAGPALRQRSGVMQGRSFLWPVSASVPRPTVTVDWHSPAVLNSD